MPLPTRLALLFCTLLASVTPQAGDYAVGERLGAGKTAPASDAKEVSWDDLLPAGWNPMKEIEALDLSSLQDADPAATAALEKIMQMWKEAPVNEKMRGRRIRLAGFAVPLEFTEKTLKEFLLVPYFGACIHVPPPPANQIVHVVLDAARPFDDIADAVWVEGTLELVHLDSDLGSAGYRLQATKLENYEEQSN